MKDSPMFWPTLLLLLACSVRWLAAEPVRQAAQATPAEHRETTRIQSYNIRYGSADDGLDRWELRRDKVIALLRDLQPDVLGLQEAEGFQLQQLLAELPRYAALGVSRDDGRLAGEGCFLLYDRSLFSASATETTWLSETPQVPGSTSYGNQIPRIATWARLVRLRDGQALQVINTHYDHRSQPSRVAASEQLLSQLEAITRRWPEEPVVLLGDFNATLENPALQRLLESGFVCAVTQHDPRQLVGTFTGFQVNSDGGSRTIDHILLRGDLRVHDAAIDTRKLGGRFPSDHFPIWTDLSWD